MKKRIFAAIDLSEDARQKVAAYIERLRREFPNLRVVWEKPEKIHLTLKFIGEIGDEQLKKLTDAVEKSAFQISNFKLQISETGVFPSPRNARILWLGLKDERKSLQKLSEILENECVKQGFAKEKRDFKAHLTLARLKEKSSELVEMHLHKNFEPVEFEVSEMVVFQSELRPTGSVYKTVSKHKFKTMENFINGKWKIENKNNI